MLESVWLSDHTPAAFSVQWLEVIYKMATFFSIFQSFGGTFDSSG